MSGTDVAIRTPQATVLTNEQLQYISKTEFVPPGLRGNLPAILACVATGRELGIGDMAALKSIHVIDGKPTFSAELMVLLVRRAGHSITGNFAAKSCTVAGKRADNGDEMSVTWTTEMAADAGLLGKSNWKKYEASMLWARAVSQLCRMLFADCFAGSTYTAEELDDGATVSAPEGAAPVWDDGKFPPADGVLEPVAAGEASAGEPTAENGASTPTVSQAPASTGELASPAEGTVLWNEDTGEVLLTSDDVTIGEPIATKAQQTLIVTKANQAGLSDDVRHALIDAVTRQPSSKLVPKSKVNAVLDEIAKVGAAGAWFQVPKSARESAA